MKYYEYTLSNAKDLTPSKIHVAIQSTANTNYIILSESTLTGSIQEFDDWASTVSWGNQNGYNIEQDQNTWFLFYPEFDKIQ